MAKMLDLTGKRFGRLTVISFDHKGNGHCYWNCQCDCGNTKIVSTALLRNGHTQSCGCKLVEHGRNMFLKHGLSDTNLYIVFRSMINRCYDPKHHAYKDYGGRGIYICDEWLNDFKVFYDWSMANGYQKGLTIDRIDNNKGYSPDNCRWTDWNTQANNKRNSKMFEYKGKKQTVSQWAKELGWGYTTLDNRLRAGWSFEKAITTPIHTECRPLRMKGDNICQMK